MKSYGLTTGVIKNEALQPEVLHGKESDATKIANAFEIKTELSDHGEDPRDCFPDYDMDVWIPDVKEECAKKINSHSSALDCASNLVCDQINYLNNCTVRLTRICKQESVFPVNTNRGGKDSISAWKYDDNSTRTIDNSQNMLVKLYICNDCDKEFKLRPYLIKHIKKTHGDAEHFSCKKCKKIFNQKNDLIAHLLDHKVINRLVCDECKQTFSFRSGLVAHLKIHTGERPFACKKCGKLFRQRSALQTHMSVHTDVKPFVCEDCKKSFSHKGDLVKHIWTHTGEKPFGCRHCNKTFTRKHNLIDHMRVHTGLKPFSCEECNKMFNRRGDLVLHLQSHTDTKHFTCKECKKVYKFKKSLLRHMRNHSSEKPFPCEVCEERFNRRDILENHMKKHKV